MRQSTLFTQTKRSVAKEETSQNAILFERGGYVYKPFAGGYVFLPLGLRVIQKISTIIREELDKLPNTSEISMTVLQPRDIWQETGRWDDAEMKTIMYRTHDASQPGKDLGMGLGPTHEEMVVAIFRSLYNNSRQLPIATYQIQTKFRNELRAKSGLLRGREFLMKDLYSFHTTKEDFTDYYEQAAAAYMRIFERCGLKAIRTKASGGVFSKEFSDEFQVVSPVGEDTIYLNVDGDIAYNEEVVPSEARNNNTAKAIEAGNIFTLGDKYTAAMKAQVTQPGGERLTPIMGCYGIGISRLMGIVGEVHGRLNDKQAAIVWPHEIAPVYIHLIDLNQSETGKELYDQLIKAGKEVLWDDRTNVSAGEKFADADLIGAPVRVIVSERSLKDGGVEVQDWPDGTSKIIAPADLLSTLN